MAESTQEDEPTKDKLFDPELHRSTLERAVATHAPVMKALGDVRKTLA